jgi:hypothetical protein
MGKYHVRHLLCLKKMRRWNVSIRRLAEALIQQEKGTILELENYILGSGYGE